MDRAPVSHTSCPAVAQAGPRRALSTALRVGVVLAAVCVAGCKTTEPSISHVFGPRGRAAYNQLREPQRLGPIEGAAEFDKARDLYEQKKYPEAAKAFKAIAKKYKDKPVEEDAMFMRAECRFHEGRYPAAQDAYGELLKKYTASRYVEPSTRRLYTIGKSWLQSPRLASEVELAQYTTGELERKSRNGIYEEPRRFPLRPNVTDKSRPMLDTDGRALQALNSVWLHDPTGPLADDALMMTATFHLRRHDYLEADRTFGILRSEYPQSEHTSSAYVLGSHVKLMAYQGAKYDGKQLNDARNLTQSTIRLFPDIPQRRRLLEDLEAINRQAVERDWEKVQLYRRKGEPRAVAIYCELILRHHPNSTQADQAREVLRKLGPEYQRGLLEKLPIEDEQQGLPPPPVQPGQTRIADESTAS